MRAADVVDEYEQHRAARIGPDELARLRADFPYFCTRMLWINPKIKELVQARESGEDAARGPLLPFRWNDAQREVWRVMCEQIDRGRPLDFAILKARQVGISTFFCAYLFWLMWRQKHVRAAIVAFEKKTTLSELRETMQTFYDSLPDDAKPGLLQKHAGATLGQADTVFADRRSRCKYVVQKKGAGRGIASDAVLCTEVSFYDEPDEFFGGFVPSMGSGPGTVLVKESSPEDGYFKDSYEEYKSDGVFRRAIFIPWWFVRDLYSRPLRRQGKKLFDEQTGIEVHLPPSLRRMQTQLSRRAAEIGRPAITDEQMWWWLHFCETKYDGDEEWMLQEFPNDDVTAFQKASRSAFKIALPIVAETVAEVEDVFPNAPGAGLLVSSTYTQPELEEQVVSFEPEHKPGWIDQEKRAGLFLLEEPNPKYTYVVGADVADADGEDDEEGERAFSVGRVYCCDTREEVAWWRGHIDPTDWGDELVKLGYFFNTALLVVERNNMGRLTEHRIRQLKYPRRFRWPDLNVGLTAFKGRQEMWETTASSKPLMISSLKMWIRDRRYIVRDPGLHHELAHYMVVRGKFEPKGAFADRIISAALCVMGVEQTGYGLGVVLGASAVRERSAHGMARRVLATAKSIPRPSDELPEEFDALGVQRIGDVYEDAFSVLGVA